MFFHFPVSSGFWFRCFFSGHAPRHGFQTGISTPAPESRHYWFCEYFIIIPRWCKAEEKRDNAGGEILRKVISIKKERYGGRSASPQTTWQRRTRSGGHLLFTLTLMTARWCTGRTVRLTKAMLQRPQHNRKSPLKTREKRRKSLQ
jgi:hypothetical protein